MRGFRLSLRLYFLFAGFLIVHAGHAQEQKTREEEAREEALGLNMVWYPGSVTLNDGTELHGQLKYNENEGKLAFESGDNLRYLTAKTCLAFKFYDAAQQQQRMFISLGDDGNGSSPALFEALFEFKSFAVLRIGRMDLLIQQESVNARTMSTPYGGTMPVGGVTPRKYRYTQRYETIYLMNERGEIRTFVSYYMKDRAGNWRDRETSDVLGLDFLKELIGKEAFDDLERYRTEKDLSYKSKEELIKIFEYYLGKWAE